MKKQNISRADFLKLTTAFWTWVVVWWTGIAITLSSKDEQNKQKNNAELYDPERLDDLPNRAFGMDMSHNNTLNIEKFYKEVQLKKLNDKTTETIPVNSVYLRIGQGLNIKDKAFSENWTTIKSYNNDKKTPDDLKMATGIYYLYDYTQSAKKQAEKFISLVESTTWWDLGQLTPMLDIEDLNHLNKKLPKDNILQKDLKIWLDIIENHFGVTPWIYSGRSFAIDHLDFKNQSWKFGKYKKWIATYNNENYDNSKLKIKQELGYLPALIQWSENISLPWTWNYEEDTDGNDTEKLPELFIKNNLIGNKYDPQWENEWQEENENDKQEDIDANTAWISGGKIGGVIGGLTMTISSILYYSRDKNETDRRAFLKKAIKVIAAGTGWALVGALSWKRIEDIDGLDMTFNNTGTTCTITIDGQEIILFRNVLDPKNKKLWITVQVWWELYKKIPIENKGEIEWCITQSFEWFEFSNRDRRKILRNMNIKMKNE